MKTKIITIFGGVYSSLGKGIVASSIGRILKEMGYVVSMQKMDPYLNVDPGLLSPYQHGEVFVTEDGQECDLDLGNYERFTNQNMTKDSSITSGKIYYEVLNDERAGKYSGRTVQIIPDITDRIKTKINNIIKTKHPHFLIIEVGGTVGDIESIPFVEALSQYSSEYGKQNFLPVLVTPLIRIGNEGEFKTKPSQHALKQLGSLGIIPSMLILRSQYEISDDVIDRLCLNSHLDKSDIFISRDLSSVYFLPNEFYKQKIHDRIFDYFNIKYNRQDNFNNWITFTNKMANLKKSIKIAIVGKYISLKDAYMSVYESIRFACIANNCDIDVKWINSDKLTNENVKKELNDVDGIIIPGGFGNRGIEGKVFAIKYARENNVPLLGICLGMQLALIEFARNVLNIDNANSIEFDQKCFPIFLSNYKNMHLGNEKCIIKPNTLTAKMYNDDKIIQRFRHRYEFNTKLIKQFEDNGFIFSAECTNKTKTICCAEYSKNDFFFLCQYHPEFKSRPETTEPSFDYLIKASLKFYKNKKK